MDFLPPLYEKLLKKRMINTVNNRILEYNWRYNEFNVDLVRDGDRVKSQTKNVDNIDSPVVQHDIKLLEKTSSEMIMALKKCQLIIDNGKPFFFQPDRGWNLKECNLNEFSIQSGQLSFFNVNDSMQWYMSFSNERINKAMLFSKAIFSSKRCSADVVNIIEKINLGRIEEFSDLIVTKIGRSKPFGEKGENESLFKKTLLLKEVLLKEFTVHRVMSKESVELELTENAKKRDVKIENDPRLAEINTSLLLMGTGTVWTSASSIVSATVATSAFLGGGFLAIIPAGIVGLYAGIFTFALGSMPAILVGDIRADMLRKKNKEEEKRERQTAPKLAPSEFLIEIEPISQPSKIDNRMRVSKFMWAVTVVTGPEGTSKNHAAIVIEGLANDVFREIITEEIPSGEYFMFKAELNPPVIFTFVWEKQYKDDLEKGMERTEIWMKSSDKVIEMLRHAFDEKAENSEKYINGERLKFNKLGKNSVFGKEDQLGGHSCFTWSREKVSMLDIHLGENWFEKILVWPRSFTKPFHFYENKPCFVEL